MKHSVAVLLVDLKYLSLKSCSTCPLSPSSSPPSPTALRQSCNYTQLTISVMLHYGQFGDGDGDDGGGLFNEN